jgi:hypothetical protein
MATKGQLNMHIQPTHFDWHAIVVRVDGDNKAILRLVDYALMNPRIESKRQWQRNQARVDALKLDTKNAFTVELTDLLAAKIRKYRPLNQILHVGSIVFLTSNTLPRPGAHLSTDNLTVRRMWQRPDVEFFTGALSYVSIEKVAQRAGPTRIRTAGG